MELHPQARRKVSEDGYVLLTLLLMLALMIISAAVILPSITFEIKRDREEELIHRGVQYARAIQHYYKKFGRYPTKIEDLENTSNLRFLRKRYKDPVTGKEFRLLHFGEVKLSFSGGMGGGSIPGASPVGSLGGTNSGGFQQPSAFGGSGGSGAPSGASSQAPNQATGPDSAESPSPSSGPNPPGSQPESQPGSEGGGNSGDQLAGRVFGGGPIVGVASSSKKETIREFNHKKKYNEWQFIYDPATDRGGLLMTPNQPQLQGFGLQGTQNAGQNSSGLGTGNSLGTSPSGMQNNLNSPSSGGFGTSNQPGNPPQQQ